MEVDDQGGPGILRPPTLRVTVEQPGAPAMILRFREPFTIGSDPECDLALESSKVSSRHAEVDYEDHCWWIRAVEGSKGIHLEHKEVEAVPLATGTVVRLGPSGPLLSFVVEPPDREPGRSHRILRLPDPLRKVIRASTRIISVEEHKEILRRMVKRAERLQTRKYFRIVAALSIVGLAAGGYAYYKNAQYREIEARAEDVFYRMKELELGFSRLEGRLAASGDTSVRAETARLWKKLEELNDSYDSYVDDLGIYKEGRDEKTRAIYRAARLFGECDVAVPEGFVQEVEHYIHEWKLSDRLNSAMLRAKEHGYDQLIARQMSRQHLPPQFLYLALQESGFDSSLCGPPTYFGIAKGMWQFIPSTAVRYGLKTGPLVRIPRSDPRDEREHVEKSTIAAARYLRDIYDTEAQASGLLVMASYNWGHNVVRSLIRELPENPRERNFWTFLKTHKTKIPKQTYDYVYFVFSAAVIGENPELFGFKFDKPAEGGTL